MSGACPIRVDAVIGAAVREATARVSSFGVSIDVDPEFPRHVLGDGTWLREALVAALEKVGRNEVALSIQASLVGALARRRARFTVASARAAVRFTWSFEPAHHEASELAARPRLEGEHRTLVVAAVDDQRRELLRIARAIGGRPSGVGGPDEAQRALRDAERLGHPFTSLIVAGEDATSELLFTARGVAGTDACRVVAIQSAEGAESPNAAMIDRLLVEPVTARALAESLQPGLASDDRAA